MQAAPTVRVFRRSPADLSLTVTGPTAHKSSCAMQIGRNSSTNGPQPTTGESGRMIIPFHLMGTGEFWMKSPDGRPSHL